MMQAEGLGHIPKQMVDRLEEATGNEIQPGYAEGLTRESVWPIQSIGFPGTPCPPPSAFKV